MGEKEAIISRRGLAKTHAALDFEVWRWKTSLENKRETRRVTKNEVQAFALETYNLAGITNFKASDGWYRRWRQRWHNSKRSLNDVDGIEVDKQNETASKNNEASTQNLPRKRKNADVLYQGKIINTEENDTRTTKLLCKDLQLGNCQDASAVEPVINTIPFQESQDSDNATLENLIPIEYNQSMSSSDSLILSVNFIKVKQANTAKKLKSNLFADKQTLDSNSVFEDVTSTITLDQKVLEENVSGKVELGIMTENSKNVALALQKETVVRSDEQERTRYIPKKCIDQNIQEKTFEVIETNDGENLWAVLDKDQIFASLITDDTACSQADSGISIPSSSTSVETTSDPFILSSIFEQDKISFSENDHELFCDSCEDFHPRQKCLHSTFKQKKASGNSFLLSCVFEKKESISVANLSYVNIKCKGASTNSTIDATCSQFNNPSVMAPKGKRYLVQFKSRVVNYALNYSVKLAAEKFKVNRNTVAEWLAESNRSSALVKHINQDVTSDSEFLAWLEDSKFNLTSELIKQKTSEYLQTNDRTNCRQSQWLWMYAQRLNGLEKVAIKKRYIVYPEAFKRAVVFHAQTHSNMAAARVFCVARKRVIEWQQNMNIGLGSKNGVHTNSNNVTDGAVDLQVYEWFCKQELTPTSRQVRSKAVELYRAAGHQSIQCGANWYYRWRARHNMPASRVQLCSSVTPLLIWTLSQLDNNKCVSQSSLAAQAASLGHKKVSRGWTFRFCKKYSALLQSLPAPETPLPSVLEELVQEYKQKLLDLISRRKLTEDKIVALDEIPLHFLPKDKAKKPLLVRRPGFESCQATLMISCLANGTLLPTLFVFKGDGPGPGIWNDPQVITAVNDTGQISDKTMQEWLSAVCFKNVSEEGVLILDSFDKHVTPMVSESAVSRNIHIAVTPPGCAFRLLPVTLFCHSFKTMLEDMCQTWLSSQTAALESPSHDQLYLWAVRTHRHVAKHHKENIRSAFKTMLLSQSESSQCTSTSS